MVKLIDYGEMQGKVYKPLAPLKPPTMPGLPGISEAFYYICAKVDGRFAVLGPYNSEAEAYEIASKKLSVPFEVVELSTRDRAKASSIMRHRILNSSSDLGLSLRRMKHRI